MLRCDTLARHVGCTITFLLVLRTQALRNCLSAASNNCAESANSSTGICDNPGRENTSSTSSKAAARRVDVVRARTRGCAWPSDRVGLPFPGPVIYRKVGKLGQFHIWNGRFSLDSLSVGNDVLVGLSIASGVSGTVTV
jgi:hypothetical protein